MKILKRSHLALAVLLPMQAFCTYADSDALIFPMSSNITTVGYINAGPGWSFVPKTNLIVTWVGYEQTMRSDLDTGWASDAGVTLWSSTNTLIAAYSSASLTAPVEIVTNSGHNGIVYGKISPLPLMASAQYYITLDRGSNALVVEVFAAASSGSDFRPFLVAPELMYAGPTYYDVTNGLLTPSATPLLMLGPTFRFLVAAEVMPRLEMKSVDNGVELTWPTRTPDCALETSTSPADPAWEEVPDAPTAIGDRYVLKYHFDDNQAHFFRLRLR